MEKYLWVEDDATLNDPTAEKIQQAWLRLFGEDNFDEQWKAAKETEVDGGDHFIRTMLNGHQVTLSFDGWYIAKKKK